MDPEILKRLDALAEKLGATGKYLWEVLVRGEFAAGLAWLIGTLAVVVILSLVSLRLFGVASRIEREYAEERADRKREREAKGSEGENSLFRYLSTSYENRPDTDGWRMGGGALAVVAVLVLGLCVPPALTQTLAPERAALKTLLGK